MIRYDRIGTVWETNNSGKLKIIEYEKALKTTVEFEDGTVLKNVNFQKIKEGKVRNPNHPSVYGVGYLGIGKYKFKEGGKAVKSYIKWTDMLRRCYSTKEHERHMTYKGCTTDKEWHNFQVFAQWFEENWKPHMEGWALDKDILVKGNKIYSPETCCFVPPQINLLFCKANSIRGNLPIGLSLCKNKKSYQVNIYKNNKMFRIGTFYILEEAFQAYKEAKENYIKEVANKWRGKITEQVYQAMYNYRVEITD